MRSSLFHVGLAASLLSLAISSGACIDAKRLNTDCRWTDNEVRLLDLSREADQRHLTRDVDLADELGIRYGDSFRKSQGINEEHARTANCTSLLFAEIRRSHGVTMEDVTKARGRREISYDLAMVLLPVAVLFCLAVSEIVRRILRRFASDERMPRVIALLLASVFVTGAGFQLGSLWSFVAESIGCAMRTSAIGRRTFHGSGIGLPCCASATSCFGLSRLFGTDLTMRAR